MEWQAIFDFKQNNSLEWLLPMIGIIMASFGYFCVWVSKTHRFNKIIEKNTKHFPGIIGNFYATTPTIWRITGWGLVCFGLLFFLVAIFSSKAKELNSIYDNKAYSVVEGVVENFKTTDRCPSEFRRGWGIVPEYLPTDPIESFNIDGVSFKYSSVVDTGGFNKTKACGGSIEEGMYLRIWHYKKIILRLEKRI